LDSVASFGSAVSASREGGTMNASRKRKSPASTGLGNRKQLGGVDHNTGRHLELLYGRRDRPGRLPENWRDRLPDPGSY
jgi:hypothetical protein